MPRRNRVTPYGELVAVADRGMFFGNRGQLLDAHGRLSRYATTKAWICCLLSFRGRRQTPWLPGRYYGLFFLDEATALAAGHRPCAECRRADYRRFTAIWSAAFPGEARAPAIDAHLHRDRLVAPRLRRSFPARLDSLPAGAMVDVDGAAWLVTAAGLRSWSPAGYGPPARRPGDLPVTVVTPRSMVAVIAAGYRPVLHPSATG